MLKKILIYIRLIPSIVKTVFVNFHIFPFSIAKKLPLFVGKDVKIHCANWHCVSIESDKISKFMIRIGTEGSGPYANKKCELYIGEEGKLVFCGKATIAYGAYIRSSGTVVFGDNFYSNCNMSLVVSNSVKFGNNVLLGWNVHLRDTDGHKILEDDNVINPSRQIVIGDDSWICQDVKILKGVNLPRHSVVAMNSCVTKSFDTENSIIGGYPAKVIKEGISWEV